jgi:DNA polymerase III alpha subunit
MDRNDSIAIDALNCIRKGLDFAHPEAKRFTCNDYYFKSPKEMKALIGFPPQLIKNTLEIAEKISVTDGYIPVVESDLSVPRVVGILNSFSPPLRIKFKPGSKHISVSLMDHKSADVLEHLRQQLLDYDIIHVTDYDPWTPRSIYSAVLNTMNVPEEKSRELCRTIPAGAKTLREAVLMSTDISCLSSEDYVCSLAAEIGDTLINTFKEERSASRSFALIPKDMPVPLVRDAEGRLRCQYDIGHLHQTGLISLEFQQ